jgi:hypothetical protein
MTGLSSENGTTLERTRETYNKLPILLHFSEAIVATHELSRRPTEANLEPNVAFRQIPGSQQA